MKKIIRLLFIYILVLWFVIGLARTFYNLVKFISQESYLLSSTEQIRRRETYGEIDNFCSFAINNTNKDSDIYFLTQDGHAFYFCRYEVYPRKMYLVNSVRDLFKIHLKKKDSLLVLETNGLEFSAEKYRFHLVKKYGSASIKGAIYSK